MIFRKLKAATTLATLLAVLFVGAMLIPATPVQADCGGCSSKKEEGSDDKKSCDKDKGGEDKGGEEKSGEEKSGEEKSGEEKKGCDKSEK
jgi:uncharacterized low-complexity protein